jgi:hypothetical protein
VGSWKTKDDLVQITLIDTGEFQYDINHGDGTLSRKRGEWYPHHAVKGIPHLLYSQTHHVDNRSGIEYKREKVDNGSACNRVAKKPNR